MAREIRVTANFEANLDDVQRFLTEADAGSAFEQLLDQLFQTVIPNLQQFPEMGVSFLERACRSIETHARISRLRSDLGDTGLREYIFGEYLILYSVDRQFVDLLSIRHHRQLSFDLGGIWL